MDLVAALGIALGVVGVMLGVIQLKHMVSVPAPEPVMLPWVYKDKLRLLEFAAGDPAFDRDWRAYVDEALEELGELRTIIAGGPQLGAPRRIAARRLGEMDAAADIWLLLEIGLTDDDWSVVQEIGDALRNARSVDVCPVLINELATTDWERQRRSVMLLSIFDTEQARDALIDFASNNPKAGQVAITTAIEGIATWEDEIACSFLIECLNSTRPLRSLQKTAAKALVAYLHSPKVLRALAAHMPSDDEYLRLAIVETLRQSYAPGVIHLLEDALDDGYWRIRRAAFQALEDRGVCLDAAPDESKLRKPPGGRPRDTPPAEYSSPDVLRV